MVMASVTSLILFFVLLYNVYQKERQWLQFGLPESQQEVSDALKQLLQRLKEVRQTESV